MKKIKVLILSVLSIFVVTSCEDSYKIIQDGELNENVLFTTVPNMQSYLNGVYALISNQNSIAFTSIFTDECGVGRSSGGQNLETHRFQLTAANGFAEAMWYNQYQVINRVNRLLAGAQGVDPGTDPVNVANYNSIIAQARAIRAYSYLELQSYFSTDMKNDSALGVMLLDYVPEIGDEPQRVSNAQIYALMEADLAFAAANISTTLTYKYVTPNMINALRARFYVYRGNYVLAQQYAQAAIAAGPALTTSVGGTGALVDLSEPGVNPNNITPPQPWSLPNPAHATTNAGHTTFAGAASANPYRRMLADLAQGEVIFALDRPAAGAWESLGGIWNTNTSTVNGSPLFEVGRKLFNIMNAIPGDIRKFANVDPSSLNRPGYATDPSYMNNDVLIIDKYPGKPGFVLRNDNKIFRTSEMYLILAECYAQAGNFNGASNTTAAIIKQIRDARKFTAGATTLPVYTNQVDALQAVLLERRIELSFEGHRYVDLKRLGVQAGVSIDRDPTDDQILGLPLTISNTDYRFTLPIPTAEQSANPTIQQNPNY